MMNGSVSGPGKLPRMPKEKQWPKSYTRLRRFDSEGKINLMYQYEQAPPKMPPPPPKK